MNVVAVVMAGGAGTRLTVLSEKRAKPSVPFAGKYRIIDFTLSNCVNSNIFNIAVLTQYRPHSLNEHIGIGKPWDLDRASGGVRLLQPYQVGGGTQIWYRGTADAVLQNYDYVRELRADRVVVLGGDHIYKMDYAKMLRFHDDNRADLTVAVMEVPLEETHRFGIMSVDDESRITAFHEKPKDRDKGTLASMGIYIFNADMLESRLLAGSEQFPDLDFGKHVIPNMIDENNVFAYRFDGYWVDVGTIDSYWATSMELLDPGSPLNLYDRSWPLLTRSQERPPVKLGPQAKVHNSLMCNGCVVRGQVERSVLSPGVYVSPGAVVRDSVVMNDTWIGPGAVLDKVVVDKEVVVGSGALVGFGSDHDTVNKLDPDKLFTGITVIGKGAHIPANVRVGRNVLINAAREEEDFAPFGDHVASGETV
ncbi:MAG: glucose-1-phosphate adenylyltransferase [Anaerolineae bacterium]|nr:glucose-1-phosphate adenylyltransferase [Anaerolineae bacterium]MCB9131165.1 glucose-1-phosphate adenylyltransferase [Anaerolineales bacterium]MCB9142798.1 glucose-1-phosphate adenylyltransferase [Anaerolineales bacterium]